jgi:phage shock protein C
MQDTIQGTPQESAQAGAPRSALVLTRSHDRMLGGVAGGLADYFDVDPTIVRLGIVLGALVSGGVVLVGYIALWIIMPEAPLSTVPGLAGGVVTTDRRGSNGALVLGVILVGVGAFALLDQFPLFHLLGWDLMRFWWPSLLIALGLGLIFARARD